MKKYVKSSNNSKEFNRYYNITAPETNNLYQVIASGNTEDDTLRLRVNRSTSTGRKIYAYALVGYNEPGRIEIWYHGLVTSEDFGSYSESNMSPDVYLDELAYRAVQILDEINESLE